MSNVVTKALKTHTWAAEQKRRDKRKGIKRGHACQK